MRTGRGRQHAGSSSPSRSAARWIVRACAAAGVVLAALAAPLACTTTIVPPAAVERPATVVLLDHGRHATLLLPAGDEGMIRYTYGDWDWYAMQRTGWLRVPAVLLWPTQGALGRAELPGPFSLDDLERRLDVHVESHWAFEAEREEADALRTRLDEICERNEDTAVYNETYDLTFVHHPQSYCYFTNSNHVMADWLRELGCEVRGPAFGSKWRVDRRE